MDQRKKILFITGTRADYGKIKPIMQRMERMQDRYEVFVYVSGMHLCRNMAVPTERYRRMDTGTPMLLLNR